MARSFSHRLRVRYSECDPQNVVFNHQSLFGGSVVNEFKVGLNLPETSAIAFGTPGYDPAFSHLSIGTYLQMRVIEDLCADPTVHTLDYGFGDAEYKRRFGTDSWEESNLLVFAPRPRALAINLWRSAVLAAVGATRTALTRAGVLDRIKQGWRRRLARRSAEGAT